MKNKKPFSLVEVYRDCFEYLIKCRWYFVFAFAVFSFFMLVGFIAPIFFRTEILEFMKNMVNVFEGKTFFQTFLAIFFNNLQAGFFAMIFGIGFGIFPLIVAIMNGYLIGFVSRLVVDLGSITELWKLLPHGIFELPAIIISIGIGIRLGTFGIRKKGRIKIELRKAIKFFIFVMIPLLLIAALIETILIFSIA